MANRFYTITLFCLGVTCLHADGPGDNIPEKVRPVPPAGVAVPEKERTELHAGIKGLGDRIAELRQSLQKQAALLELLPDIEIYHKAVETALVHNEFFNAKEIPIARALLSQGLERARLLADGKAPWTTATGLVVRGYRSRLDDSVQPYGLVVPASYQPGSAHQHRLDAWFHGRGETLSELNFINGRQRSVGEFAPPHTFVLHPYGRYCNANKLAGEVDLFEALAHVRKHYPIDENRIVMRGFSMGGAACWQFAVHYAGLWAAAAPGAGFSETPDFLKVFQKETLKPTWYEQKLWHMYDCTDYAVNLYHCPVVAYSGELDSQKQAADMMAKALEAEGMDLVHIIGPKTRHAYHPEAKKEIDRRLDSIVARGRETIPQRVRFTTWTLRYNEMAWIRLDGLERHWDRARVEAAIAGPSQVQVQTQNISALSFIMPPGRCPFDNTQKVTVILDGDQLQAPAPRSDRSWNAHFEKQAGKWVSVTTDSDTERRKKHGLQGPIDDAFLDRFLFVSGTGEPLHSSTGAWFKSEMEHARDHWRKQFRGNLRMKSDASVTDQDITESNLILWGDPSSNRVLAKIAGQLPIVWDKGKLTLNPRTYSAEHHVPVMIYPNPLNPKRYVVLNSGFTFRDYDYLNNARQVPKLPDFAVIDIRTPPNSRFPGKIVDAGFFGERWEWQPDGGRR